MLNPYAFLSGSRPSRRRGAPADARVTRRGPRVSHHSKMTVIPESSTNSFHTKILAFVNLRVLTPLEVNSLCAQILPL
jgi:hypothetical protein